MTGNACRFSLYRLCTANLQSLGRGIAVQRHILCLEGGRVVAVLLKNATQGGGDDAFADITARSYEHDRVEPTPNPSQREGGKVRMSSVTSPLLLGGEGGRP